MSWCQPKCVCARVLVWVGVYAWVYVWVYSKSSLLLENSAHHLRNGVLSVCRGTTFPVDHTLVSWLRKMCEKCTTNQGFLWLVAEYVGEIPADKREGVVQQLNEEVRRLIEVCSS